MSTSGRPFIVVLAGPNGAGKTTSAEAVLQRQLSVSEFVNADRIALGMSDFDPDAAAIAAGRVISLASTSSRRAA
jgi:predicted ABC-type ATPase